MSQPATYNRSTSFTNLQATNPTGQPPGNLLDVEFNNVKATTDGILSNLKLIQKDDGTLANGSVGLSQLSAQVTVGFTAPTAWATGKSYVAAPASTVFNGGKFYSCLVSHTSATFATDLAAGDWVLIANLTAIPLVAASQIAVTANGGLVSSDVQTSLNAIDAGKAATSHTHPSTAISDSTAAGRAMLIAANLAAQQTLLGLGALAFLNSVTITSIPQNFAFTGVISPAALGANTNDWAPTNLGTSTRVRVSASSAVNLTGLSAQSDGVRLFLENVGANTITLTNQDTNSAAANRFILPFTGGYQLKANQSIELEYDATTARWRLFGWHRPEITAPNITVLLSGTAQTYTTPTDANGNLPLYLRVRMVGGGGGGAAASTNNGANGSDTLFGAWTAIHGTGGTNSAGAPGIGGSGGTNGTGTLVRRIGGGSGGGTLNVASGTANGGIGGSSAFGGAGASGANGAGGAAATNSGSGGGGGGTASAVGGSGGGSGESVEFIIPSPAASFSYTVGPGGNGGAAGNQAGGNGAAGRIEVEAFWQ